MIVTSTTLPPKGLVIFILPFRFLINPRLNYDFVESYGAINSFPYESTHLLVSVLSKQAMTD
jgi:hypothetical protein